jgi:hypothetical protein
MTVSFHNDQRGSLNTIVLIVVGLMILGYFNIDLQEIVENPLVIQNLKFGFELIIRGITYIFENLVEIFRAMMN